MDDTEEGVGGAAPRMTRVPESSCAALGYEATILRLERLFLTCHPSTRSAIEDRISRARRCEGPTLFDEIVGIIHDHAPGGRESEDGVLLELV
jgi:hypothetical protein